MEYIVARGSAGRETQYEFDTLCKAYQVLSGTEYVPKKGKSSFGRSSSSVGSAGSKGSKGKTGVEEEEPEDEPIPGKLQPQLMSRESLLSSSITI